MSSDQGLRARDSENVERASLEIRPPLVLFFPLIDPVQDAGFCFEGVMEEGTVLVMDPPLWMARAPVEGVSP